MKAVELASRLSYVRATGDHYLACCPAHEDRTPSLSFRDGREGVLVHCWAGCSVEAIAHAVGIGVSALFHTPHDRRRRNTAARPPGTAQEWRQIWTETLRRAESTGRVLAVWQPIYARADAIRHARRLADTLRGRATGMSPDDPAMWDEAELAVLFDDEARLAEIEANELTVAARRGSR